MRTRKIGKRITAFLLSVLMILTAVVSDYSSIGAEAFTLSGWEVFFHMNDGSDNVFDTAVVKHNNKVARPATDPVREGYTFTGWYKDKAAKNEFDFNKKIKGDTSVYAGWNEADTDVKVAVYTTDGLGVNTPISPSFGELLGLNYKQPDGYYPVGVITIPKSIARNGIQSQNDWDTVAAAISAISTAELSGAGVANAGNSVGANLKYVIPAFGQGAGSQKTALFGWGGDSISIAGDYKYHLDLQFATYTVTVYGVFNDGNGIQQIGSTNYLSGAKVVVPSTSEYESTYDVAGYFIDEACTIPLDTNAANSSNMSIYVKLNHKPLNVKVEYSLPSGADAAAAYEGTCEYGGSFSVDSPSVTGYTPEEENVTRSNVTEDTTVVVYYNPIDCPFNVTYTGAPASKLPDKIETTKKFASAYEIVIPEIEGYVGTSDVPVTGTINSVDGITAVVTYEAKACTLTINYVDENGAAIADPYTTSTIKYDATYDVESPSVAGYTIKDAAQSVISGTVDADETVIDVVYTTNKYTVKVTYTGAPEELLPSNIEEELAYKSDYSYNTPEITGYTADKTVVEGKVPVDGVEVVVTYTANPYPYKVTYVGGPEGQMPADIDTTLPFGTDYSVPMPAITGYSVSCDVAASGKMTVDGVEAVVTYTANSYPLTIKYVDKVTKATMAATYKTEVPYGQDYSVPSPVIEGYEATVAVVSGTMDSTKGKTITVKYSVLAYDFTVKYIYEEDGTDVFPEYNGKVIYGGTYGAQPRPLTGYHADKDTVTGTMPAEPVTITFIYSKNSYNLTINYVSDDGTALPIENIVVKKSVSYNDPYEVVSPVFAGWTTPDKVVSAEHMPAEDVEVTVVYSRGSYVVTVNYLYEDGTTAADTKTTVKKHGADYSIDSPVIVGYTPSKDVVSGTIDAADVTEDVVYTINNHSLTIHYVYEGGATAAPDFTSNYDYDEEYSISSPVITGYTASLPTVTGNMPDEDVEETVYYAANSYNLTIHYQYEDGSEASGDYSETVDFSEEYSVESPVIEGYTASLPTVAGNMPAEDVEVTVVYSINSHMLQITYVYEDGTTAAETYSESYDYAQHYNVESPTIEGYTATPAVVEGNMPDDDVNETVVYTINSYDIVIHYVYEDGTTAASDYTDTLDYMEAYNVASPAIEGYTPDKSSVSGNMVVGGVEETVTYVIDTHTLTINYVSADGLLPEDQIPEQYYEVLNYNQRYNVETPVIKGYTADVEVVSGFMGTEDVEVTVSYTINEYTVSFFDENGELIDSATVNYGGTYNAIDAPVLPDSEDGQFHYDFAGWKNMDTDEFVEFPVADVEADLNVQAVYDEVAYVYTVNFVDADKATLLATSEVTWGEFITGETRSAARDAANEIAKNMSDAILTYSFVKWVDENGDDATALLDAEIKADITVYATYADTTNTYTVTYHYEDGSVYSDPVVGVEAGKDYTVISYGPAKAKTNTTVYEFAGWATVSDGNLEPAEATIYITGDVDLYPLYNESTRLYTVTFVDYDGTKLKVQKVEYNGRAKAPADPSRAAVTNPDGSVTTYTFRGWDTSFAKVTKNITVTAMYSEETTNPTPGPTPGPTPEPTPGPTPGPTPNPTPVPPTPAPEVEPEEPGVEPTAEEPDNGGAEPNTVEIIDEAVPEAALVDIEDEDVAKASADKCFIHWIILLTTLIYGLYAVIRGVSGKKEDEEDEQAAGQN